MGYHTAYEKIVQKVNQLSVDEMQSLINLLQYSIENSTENLYSEVYVIDKSADTIEMSFRGKKYEIFISNINPVQGIKKYKVFTKSWDGTQWNLKDLALVQSGGNLDDIRKHIALGKI